MVEEAPLLNEESDHPHDVVFDSSRGRIVAMDSARYVDGRNSNRDVVVPSSYLGVLPARLMAPHRPRAVIAHDGCIGKDGAGIAGLWYLEAIGIPAAAAAGMSAELGNGIDLYETGTISRINILAERAGVKEGMSVVEAAKVLLENDPGDISAGTKIRRQSAAVSDTGREIIVTDSIVFALPEDNKNVLVTAGHTGRSGAKFLLEVSPHGFICSDGGMSKNNAGIAGLETTQEHGLAGACCDAWSAPVGDAFKAFEEGTISACNEIAAKRGVEIGMTVREAAFKLLEEVNE
tara:strand:+ start:519 stop:1391 length:873 start_codon:yes stop_codon:yes gene_type:complete